MMDAREQLYFLLDKIADINSVTTSGKPVVIDPLYDLNKNYRPEELARLFSKLQQDEKVLKVLKVPNREKDELDEFDPYEHADDGCWYIELTPSFNDYFLKIQHEPEYQKFTGKTPPNVIRKKPHRKSLEKIWNLLQEIETKRGITSEADDISIMLIDPKAPVSQINTQADERRNILRKLENDDKAIKDVRLPEKINEYVYFKLGDKYADVYDYYEKEYETSAKTYQKGENLRKIQELYDKITKVDEQIELRRQAFAKAQSNINDNPMYSEATRVGQLAKLEQQAQTDISNFINQKDTYIKEISLRKGDVLAQSPTKQKYEEIIGEIRQNSKSNTDLDKRYKDTIENIKAKKTTPDNKIKVSFNSATRTLEIKNTNLKFKQDSFRAKLVSLLFKKKDKLDYEWSWDEVLEEIEGITDTDLLKENKKRFYPACDGLSKAIAQKSGVNDLLIYTKSTVKINPKYQVS